MYGTLNNEDRLILLCCRTKFTADQKNEICQLLKKDLSWNTIADTVRSNGVSAIFYAALSQIDLTGNEINIPQNILNTLQLSYYANIKRNMKLEQEIHKVLKLHHEAGIPVMLLKGFALAHFVYGDISLRQMNDIDILVKQDSMWESFHLLLKNGYQQILIPYNNWYLRNIHLFGKHLPDLANGFNNIDVHIRLIWNKIYEDQITTEAWQHAKKLELNNYPVYLLSPEYNLIYLCLHIQEHIETGWFQLRLFLDLNELLVQSYDEIDWKKFEGLISKFGLSEMISEHLALTHFFLAAPIPDWIPELSKSAYDLFLKNLSLGKGELHADIAIEDIKATLLHLKGWHTKFRYLLAAVFPSVAFMRNRYQIKPGCRVFPYYLKRLRSII